MNEIDKILRMKLIGACCREHRIKVLGLTLQQFQDKTGIKLKTISNFENGRSGNAYYMFYYINLTDDNKKADLILDIANIMKEVTNNEI